MSIHTDRITFTLAFDESTGVVRGYVDGEEVASDAELLAAINRRAMMLRGENGQQLGGTSDFVAKTRMVRAADKRG